MAEVKREKLDISLLDSAFENKLKWIKEICSDGDFDSLDTANFDGTAHRSAKAFAEMVRPKSEIAENCKSFMKSFPIGESYVNTIEEIDEDTNEKNVRVINVGNGMITVGPIKTFGLCPHHLLPVEYTVYLCYIPQNGENSKVLGLSKLPRIAKEVSKFPMLQESYARNLADILYEGNDWLEGINSAGSCVLVMGQHGCVLCRGVQEDCITSCAEVRGCFADDPRLEDKFYKQIENVRHSGL